MRFIIGFALFFGLFFVSILCVSVWFELQPSYELPGEYQMELSPDEYVAFSESFKIITSGPLKPPSNCAIVDQNNQKIELRALSTNINYSTPLSSGHGRFCFTIKQKGLYTFHNTIEIEETIFGGPIYTFVSYSALITAIAIAVSLPLLIAILAVSLFWKHTKKLIDRLFAKKVS